MTQRTNKNLNHYMNPRAGMTLDHYPQRVECSASDLRTVRRAHPRTLDPLPWLVLPLFCVGAFFAVRLWIGFMFYLGGA